MDNCPFCKQAVAEDLLRFGGACPHCFIEIPGEEAPTNPGVPAEAEAPAEPEPAGGAWKIAVAALLLLGVGGAAAWQMMPGPEPEPVAQAEEDAFPTLSFDEISEIHKAEEPETPEEVTSTSSGSNSQARRPSAPDTTGEIAQLDRFKRADGGPSAQNTQRSGLSPTSNGPGFAAPELQVDLSVGGAALTDPQLIMRMIKDTILDYYAPQIKRCYQQQVNKNPDLSGTWYLDFTIRTNGETKGVSARSKRGGGNDELEACMVRTAERWEFRKLAKSQPVTYPFTFEPSGL